VSTKTYGNNGPYIRQEPGSSFWLYTFPSVYHPLIKSKNTEFWIHYTQIRNDEKSDEKTKNDNYNYLKKMMILKESAYPKAHMFWLTIILILYLIFCFYTDSNITGGVAIYLILILVCIGRYFFAKRSGNVNWGDFIAIATNNNKTDFEKESQFKELDAHENNLEIAKASSYNRSYPSRNADNLAATGIRYLTSKLLK
jgi:hypothetical protein